MEGWSNSLGLVPAKIAIISHGDHERANRVNPKRTFLVALCVPSPLSEYADSAHVIQNFHSNFNPVHLGYQLLAFIHPEDQTTEVLS